MDAEGQNRECDRFTSKGMEKKKTILSWFIFLLHKLCFLIKKII
jgi:hypothetical protein